MNYFEILKKLWFVNNFLLIALILLQKGDDENFNVLKLPFINSTKKTKKFINILIWVLIFLYFIFAMIFSNEKFT